MGGDEAARLVYLVLMGVAVGGWLMAEHRQSLGRTLRMALAWTFIFLGMIAVAGLWSDIRDEVIPRQAVFAEAMRVETPRAFDGHYYLTLEFNGVPVDFVVDTGATDVVLTREDAQRLGVETEDLLYAGRANTANGVVDTARIRVEEVTLGPIRDRNLPVLINKGEMDMSLLGMSYLQRFERLEISSGRLILER